MGLLEVLAFKSCCMYLSDLHNRGNLSSIQHAVREIDPEQYGLEEWNDAVRYITGKDVTVSTREEAVRHLLAARDRKNIFMKSV